MGNRTKPHHSDWSLNYLMGILMFFGLASVVSGPSMACSSRSIDGINHADLEKQRILAREVAIQADTIVVAKVVGRDLHKVKLEEVTTLKGQLDGQLIEQDPNGMSRFGCAYSVAFHNVNLLEGKRYIVYLENGRILRAGLTGRTVNQLSFDEEKRIVDEVDP